MKIRISGNSIRLRLSKTDVAQLKQYQHVSDKTIISGQEIFRYTLRSSSSIEKTRVTFQQGEILISIPQAQANIITDTDQIGVEELIENGTVEKLLLLIEKDLKCLDGNRGEQSDMYNHRTKDC